MITFIYSNIFLKLVYESAAVNRVSGAKTSKQINTLVLLFCQ